MTNWTIDQTKKLFNSASEARASGLGLATAFKAIATLSSRSENSVRNYYYSQLKMFSLVPQIAKDLGITLEPSAREDFILFSDEQIDELLRAILVGKAKGKSVRAIINELSGGSSQKALRLQNKYRSMIARNSSRVNAVMNSLELEKIPYFNPYLKQTISDGANNSKKLNDYITTLNESEAGEFLLLMKKLFA